MERLSHIINHFERSYHKDDVSVESVMNRCTLTDEQKEFYKENGYLIVRGLLNQKECDILNNRFDELISNPSLRPPELVIMRDITLPKLKNKRNKILTDTEVTKIQNVGNDEIYLKHHLKNPKILDYIRGFIGNDIRGLNYMHISKPPDTGCLSSRHALHQDLWYYPLSNEDKIIAAWTALQYVGRKNGGLSVVPGSHKTGLHIHHYPKWPSVNYKYYGINDDAFSKFAAKRIHLEMYPGDTVFFHPYLIHGSGANLSKNTRKAIVTHFLNSKEVDFIDFQFKEQDPEYYEKKGQNDSKIGGSIGFNQLLANKDKIKEILEKNGIKRVPSLQLVSKQIEGSVGNWGLSDNEIKFWQKYYFKRNVDESNWKQ